MNFRTNPGTRRMWAASDAHLPGSGQQLESWALEEIQKAVQSGQLDMNNSIAVRGFLGSLGITPEKGGGRFLYNKFMGPESPLRGIKASSNVSNALGQGGMGPAGMGAMTRDPLRMTGPMGGAAEMGRNELMGTYGTGQNITLGPLAQPDAMTNDWSNWR